MLLFLKQQISRLETSLILSLIALWSAVLDPWPEYELKDVGLADHTYVSIICCWKNTLYLNLLLFVILSVAAWEFLYSLNKLCVLTLSMGTKTHNDQKNQNPQAVPSHAVLTHPFQAAVHIYHLWVLCFVAEWISYPSSVRSWTVVTSGEINWSTVLARIKIVTESVVWCKYFVLQITSRSSFYKRWISSPPMQTRNRNNTVFEQGYIGDERSLL